MCVCVCVLVYKCFCVCVYIGPVFAAATLVLEELNGIDEILDVGNGFVNTEFARRAALLPRAGMTHQRRGVGPWGRGNTTCIEEEEDSSLREGGGEGGWEGGGWGVEGWVLPNVVVEHIESRRFGLAERAGGGGGGEKEGLWARSYGNYPLYLMKMNLIAMGLYPLRSPNRCAHVVIMNYVCR